MSFCELSSIRTLLGKEEEENDPNNPFRTGFSGAFESSIGWMLENFIEKNAIKNPCNVKNMKKLVEEWEKKIFDEILERVDKGEIVMNNMPEEISKLFIK